MSFDTLHVHRHRGVDTPATITMSITIVAGSGTTGIGVVKRNQWQNTICAKVRHDLQAGEPSRLAQSGGGIQAVKSHIVFDVNRQ